MAAAASLASPVQSVRALRLETASSSAVSTATTLTSNIAPATPSLRAEPTSLCGTLAEPSRHLASWQCSSHRHSQFCGSSVLPNSSDADVSVAATWHSWRAGATRRWARIAGPSGSHTGRTRVTITGAANPLGRHGSGDNSKCDYINSQFAPSQGRFHGSRTGKTDGLLNHGRRNSFDAPQKRMGADLASQSTASALSPSALSSSSGSYPTTTPPPIRFSPSRKAQSAGEAPSVATAAGAGVASAFLTDTATTNSTTSATTTTYGNSAAIFSPSLPTSLPLTVPRLTTPIQLGPHAHRQTGFAAHLAAQISLFSVLALLQPISALALAQPARGTASALSPARRTSSSASSSSADATLLLPTCPATWLEQCAAAEEGDSVRLTGTKSRLGKSALTKHRGSRRLIASAKAAAADAQLRTGGSAVAGVAVAERAGAGGAIAGGAIAGGAFAASGLDGDDWVPANGNGVARGGGGGNGRASWGVRGGEMGVGRGERGEWQAVSLAEAREMAEPPFRVSAPGQRIVAIGDVHGDWEQTVASLRIAGVLSEKDGVSDEELWTGGSTVLVQVGDVLDRGDDEIAILSLLRHLDRLAAQHGGGVLMLNGNHETMNVAEEFRYVSEGGFEESEEFYSFCLSECAGDWDTAFSLWWKASPEIKASKKKRRGRWTGWNPIQGQRQMRERRHELFEFGGPIAAELLGMDA